MGFRVSKATGGFAHLLFMTALAVCLGVAPAATRPTAPQSSWKITFVDEGKETKVDSAPWLTIDRDGNFHVSYFDAQRNALRYAFRAFDQDVWLNMEVDSGGAFSSVAVGADGRPHFIYTGPFEDGLRYAHWDGKAWRKQIIDRELIDFFVSIRLDSKGLPRIGYYHRLWRQNRSYALHAKYARFDGTAWYVETVDNKEGTGKFSSMMLDAQDNPHICYSDVYDFSVRYAHWDGKDWNYGTADSPKINATNSVVMTGIQMDLDSRGKPHVVYLDSTRNTVRYAFLTDRGWNTEVVGAMLGVPHVVERVSLKLDSKGNPHVAYYDTGPGALQYAVRTPKGWRIERVDEGGVGRYPLLVLDASDRPAIAYLDETRQALRFATRLQK
jgi:hypothetical protein